MIVILQIVIRPSERMWYINLRENLERIWCGNQSWTCKPRYFGAPSNFLLTCLKTLNECTRTKCPRKNIVCFIYWYNILLYTFLFVILLISYGKRFRHHRVFSLVITTYKMCFTRLKGAKKVFCKKCCCEKLTHVKRPLTCTQMMWKAFTKFNSS